MDSHNERAAASTSRPPMHGSPAEASPDPLSVERQASGYIIYIVPLESVCSLEDS